MAYEALAIVHPENGLETRGKNVNIWIDNWPTFSCKQQKAICLLRDAILHLDPDRLIAMLVHVDACIWMSWFMREHVHIETLVNWFLRTCHAEELWRIDAYGDRRGYASAIVEKVFKDKWKRKTQAPEENVRGREDWPYLYVNRPWRERLEVAARSFITWWVFSCSSAAILVLLSTCTECTKLRIYESSMAMHLSQNGYGKAQVHAIFISVQVPETRLSTHMRIVVKSCV